MLPDPSTTKTKLNFCVTQAVKKSFSKSIQSAGCGDEVYGFHFHHQFDIARNIDIPHVMDTNSDTDKNTDQTGI